MHYLPNEISTSVLTNKIKSLLFDLGLNEKYIAFDYISNVLTCMIKQNNNSIDCFKKAIQLTTEKYQVSEKTIIQGMNKMIKLCNNDFTSNIQFNLKTNSTLNKIKILKLTIEQQF